MLAKGRKLGRAQQQQRGRQREQALGAHQGIRGASEQKRRLKGRALQKTHVICPVALLAGRQLSRGCRGCLGEKKGSNP